MVFCDDSESNMSCSRPPAGLPLKHSSPASQDARPQSFCQEISPSEEFGLFRLPAEVQAMIYREYFISISSRKPNTESQPPNLLAAVRCRSEIYRKVHEAYCRHYEFMLPLRRRSIVNFDKKVSVDLVRSIRHLTIGNLGLNLSAPRHLPSRYFQPSDFLDELWNNRHYMKIHQAMQLRSVTINVRLDFSQPEVLPVLELAFNSFPLLRDLKFCVFQTPNFRGKQVPRLRYEVESLRDKLKLTSMVTYVKVPQRRKKEIGLECRWLGANGIERRFVMEKKIERNEKTPEGTGPITRDYYYC